MVRIPWQVLSRPVAAIVTCVGVGACPASPPALPHGDTIDVPVGSTGATSDDRGRTDGGTGGSDGTDGAAATSTGLTGTVDTTSFTTTTGSSGDGIDATPVGLWEGTYEGVCLGFASDPIPIALSVDPTGIVTGTFGTGREAVVVDGIADTQGDIVASWNAVIFGDCDVTGQLSADRGAGSGVWGCAELNDCGGTWEATRVADR